MTQRCLKDTFFDFIKAVLRGIWDGFGITDTLVIVIIVLFYFSGELGLHVFEDHPPAWLVTLIAGIFVAFEVLRATYRLYVTERKRREAYEDGRTGRIAKAGLSRRGLSVALTANGGRGNGLFVRSRARFWLQCGRKPPHK